MASNSNPFDDEQSLDANPFADPTISHALQSHTAYDNSSAYTLETPTPSAKTPGRSTTAPGGPNEEELRRREEELERRERELNERQEHIKRHGRNNWPPFYPLIYHSIQDEIPDEHKVMVTNYYRIWLSLLALLLWNFISCLILLISHASGGTADLGASIGYCFTITAGSFLGWYRPVYNAFMKERSLYYYIYFVFMWFHIAFCAYMALGIPSTGSAGLINTIDAFGKGSILAGVFGVIASAGWVAQGLINLLLLKKVHAHYKSMGHTFEQAKNDLTKKTATAAISAQMNSGRGDSRV